MGESLCPWEPAEFFIFSENVPTLLYYSHFTAVIAALLVGIFVFVKNKEASTSWLLLSLFGLFSFWALMDVFIWATNRTDLVMFLWSLQVLVEPIIYAAAFYLFYVFTHGKYPGFKINLAIGAILLPLIILTPTHFNLEGIYIAYCDAVEGPLALYYTYVLETLFILGIVSVAFKGIGLAKARAEKLKIIYFAFGIIAFLLAFTSGNIVGSITEDWNVAQYGIFGMPVFIGFLGFLIVKFKVFNIKLLGAQALVVSQFLFIGSIFFFVQSTTNRILVGITIAITSTAGWLLIRSVKKEVKRKEELQELSEDLSVANERLKELDKVKTEFVSIASHQLRSPLSAVKGYASMLMEGSFGELTVGAKEAVGRIFTSSAFMARSVDDFLNVSRIELGRMQYDMSMFDICKIIELVIDEQQPFAKEKKLTLKFEKRASVKSCEIYADIGKIKQVLTNLVDNAIKYTPKGSITVTFDRDIAAQKVKMEVTDTGMGMSQETIDKLFGKFARADNANEVNVIGTGLGLYVAKNLIQAQGGKIWVTSPGDGKGSTFHIELPMTAKEEEPLKSA